MCEWQSLQAATTGEDIKPRHRMKVSGATKSESIDVATRAVAEGN